MTPTQRRAARIAQAQHRGSNNSHVTDLENALLVLAWEAELLSEGQMAAILDLDRVSVRKLREDLLARAMVLADALRRPSGWLTRTDTAWPERKSFQIGARPSDPDLNPVSVKDLSASASPATKEQQ